MGFLDVCIVAGVAGFLAWALRLGIELAPAARIQRFRWIAGNRLGISSLAWSSASAALFALLVVVAWRFRSEPASTNALVRRAERIELVERMRSMIAEACDAESAAVMSTDAGGARASVDRSRVAIEETARAKDALVGKLEPGSPAIRTLSDFADSFAEFEQVGRELGTLAPKNTNVLARELAFGPAADAVDRMDAAAARLVAKSASAPDAKDVARLALGSVVAARRIQALLPQHIVEASDAEMDRIEARMKEGELEASQDLAELGSMPARAGDDDVSALASAFGSFREARAKILALSRENTNVRSLEIAAGKMRAAQLRCQDALDELQRSIHDAPVDGVRTAPPFNPRRLRAEGGGGGVQS